MPNWCNNTVTISHADKSKLHALVEAINEGKFCNHVIPVPESLHIVAGRVGDDTDPKQIELEAAEKSNIATHGYATWYDFCVARWGTKWDVDPYDKVEYDDQHDPSVTFGFDSAWAPPIGVYEELVEQGFSVRAYYNEGGMAFAGRWEDGVDDFYEYGGMKAAEIRETLPEDLDDCMAISESVEAWEEDEEESE